MNKLYYGDCLDIMGREIAPESVDLIYLDPPFNSNRDYHTIYKDATGRPIPVQAQAFTDMWRLNADTEKTLQRIPQKMGDLGVGADVIEFWNGWMEALRHLNKSMLAYLAYMVERILVMKAILKPTGSLYFHCDPTASHYLKVIMDLIFGHEHFQNEFIWYYGGGGASKKRWGRKHDVLLFYSKSNKWTFNSDQVRVPYKWTDGQKRADGSERNLEKGKLADDVWQHHGLMPWSKENLGYATQKPLVLLERIVMASSNPGDLVLDPFCGCATTLHAAHNLGRRWIGIDISIHAIKKVAVSRLAGKLRLKEGEHFEVDGVPRDMEGARDLWRKDSYQFQKWVTEQVEGIVTLKKSADGGIDGRVFYIDPTEGKNRIRSMIVEVKGGENVDIKVVRALIGVLESDSADMAGLIVMDIGKQKKENFLTAMAKAGEIQVMGKTYSKVQLLTVQEILDGKRFETPNIATSQDPQTALNISTN